MTLNVENKQNVLLYRAKRRGRHCLKLLYQRFNPSSETQPVFILGSGRSGTDIVAYCLSKGWDVELINEDNPKAFDNWRLKGLEAVGRAVDSSKARLVMFKPIVETLRAREFLEAFPGGSIIFVVRNPYDAINSMVRFFGEGHVKAVKSWVETDFAQQSQAPDALRRFIADHCHDQLSLHDAAGLYWLLYNDSYRFLELEGRDDVLLVGYEDLVSRPVPATRRFAKFLDMEWSEAMTHDIYAKSVGKNNKPNLDPQIEARCLETWEYLKSRV